MFKWTRRILALLVLNKFKDGEAVTFVDDPDVDVGHKRYRKIFDSLGEKVSITRDREKGRLWFRNKNQS